MVKHASIRFEFLIDLAKAKSGDDIFPVHNAKKLEEGFRELDNELYLWYNDRTGSTHLVSEHMSIKDALKEGKQCLAK